ncbi:MAG: DUF4105 domain-containing protein [Muribaculaceae bacterium]|nr:DUF4105 domain-containing protein [Muribaculaceae bacterium]
MKKTICHLLLSLLAVTSSYGQQSDSLIVEFITCSPGSEIYELEGHAGLRLHIPGGEDVILNWGLFDFNSDNFAYRFVKGETDYMAGAVPTEYFLRYYRDEGRSVHAHVLNLTREEKERLSDAIRVNLLPQNRVYRYNYVKDNCSTRPLSMIEQVVGDTIRTSFPEDFSSRTFREAMRHYHSNYPWYQLGVDIALGNGIDKAESPRSMMFAPDFADIMLPTATIGGRPLVLDSYYLTGDTSSNAVDAPTPWYLSPLFCSIIILVAAILLTIRDLRRGRISRWFDTLLYATVFIVSVVVTFLVFFSSHEATSPNWQMLIFNPLSIIGVAGIWIKRAQSLVFCWQIVNFVALILLLILWLWGVQELNPAVIILTVTDLLRSSAYIFEECHRSRKD